MPSRKQKEREWPLANEMYSTGRYSPRKNIDTAATWIMGSTGMNLPLKRRGNITGAIKTKQTVNGDMSKTVTSA